VSGSSFRVMRYFSFTQDEKSSVVSSQSHLAVPKTLEYSRSREVTLGFDWKHERACEEQNAYPPRALTEITYIVCTP